MSINLEALRKKAILEAKEEKNGYTQRKEDGGWMKKSALISLSIEAILKRKGMSKQALAVALGVSPSQVTKLLSGKENLSLKTICRIEEALDENILNITNLYSPYNDLGFVPHIINDNAKMPLAL